MRIITMVIALCVLQALLTGCGPKEKTLETPSEPTIQKATQEATEEETVNAFDETFIEDKDIDVGEII